jgi:protein-S-isoprenylcysteine O-methyltransferase Ste14
VRQALAGLAFLIAVLAAATLLPARTLDFWQAWVLLGVFAAASLAITLDLAKRDPALLARRVKAGPIAEPSARQKALQALASLAFLALFVVPGLDHHAGWSSVPAAVAIAGDVLVALGFAIVSRVFRANTFTSAVVEVAPEQQLVSTGPYAIVRHPMYAGALVLLAGIPLALGSWWGLAGLPAMIAVIAARLVDEERLLARELAGYEDYRNTVRYRLIPRVW